MTAQPTDADRAKAAEIAGPWWSWHVPNEVDGLRERIAQALADARQPFLDLADRIAEQATPLRSAPEATARWHGLALSEIASRIRDAAEDPGDPA